MFIQNGINIQAPAAPTFSAPSFQMGNQLPSATSAQLDFGFQYQQMMDTSTILSQGWNAFLSGSLQIGQPAPLAQPTSYQNSPMSQFNQLIQMIQSLMMMMSSQMPAAPSSSYQNNNYQAQPTHYEANRYEPKPRYEAEYKKPTPKPKYKKPAPKPKYQKPAPKPQPRPRPPLQIQVQPFQPPFMGGQGGDGGGGPGGGTPVVLDLNNDGKFDVTGTEGKKIEFDLFGDGTKLKTEWLKEGTRDGLLVADFNGDGKIDSGRELMRNTGVNGEQHKYATGWEKVRALFDENQDGKVNGDELNNLQVWVDANGDGKTDPGELQSVAAHGVSEIDIPPSGEMVSSFVKDGQTQLAEDILFDYELL